MLHRDTFGHATHCHTGQTGASIGITQSNIDHVASRGLNLIVTGLALQASHNAARICFSNYFLGAHGLAGAQGLSLDFFDFFLTGAHGLPGAQGFAADLAALALVLGEVATASAACTTVAGTTSAVASNNADNLLVNFEFEGIDFFIE
jgi:hypothetical protein